MESDFGEDSGPITVFWRETDWVQLCICVCMCVLIWGAALNEVQRGAAIERCADASNYRC